MKNVIIRTVIIANMLLRTVYSFKSPYHVTRMRFSTAMRQTTMKLQTGIVGLPNVGKVETKSNIAAILVLLAYLWYDLFCYVHQR